MPVRLKIGWKGTSDRFHGTQHTCRGSSKAAERTAVFTDRSGLDCKYIVCVDKLSASSHAYLVGPLAKARDLRVREHDFDVEPIICQDRGWQPNLAKPACVSLAVGMTAKRDSETIFLVKPSRPTVIPSNDRSAEHATVSRGHLKQPQCIGYADWTQGH